MSARKGTFTGTDDSEIANIKGNFTVSVSGMGAGDKVAMKRSFDDKVTWGLVETFTEDFERNGEEVAGCHYKLECTVFVTGPTIKWLIWGDELDGGA